MDLRVWPEMPPVAPGTSGTVTSDISLAQWALVEEMRAGKWKNLDFPGIARNDFELNGIEFVNTLFDTPTADYLNQLKQRSADHGVTMVLIMVDEEGDAAAATAAERKQFAINHRKWVDIAHYLGCRSIRTNCRGPVNVDQKEALHWAAESYDLLLRYASDSGIRILIENHGGVSDNADWMIELMKKVNHPSLGIYPDWRSPGLDYDNVEFLRKTLPYSMGMSYRNQPDDAQTLHMIELCKAAGYEGWYGIESSGREAIAKGISILKKWVIPSGS